MPKTGCPLCGRTVECSHSVTQNGYLNVICKTYDIMCLLDEDLLELDNSEVKERVLDLIVEHLLHYGFCYVSGHKRLWKFFYDPSYEVQDADDPELVNMAEHIESFPDSVVELADRALMNISYRYPNYGEVIGPHPDERRIVFDHKGADELYMGVYELLEDLSLLKGTGQGHVYKISAKGWERISELQHKEKEIRQGFIAMQFGDETKPIREAFRRAITEAGYGVRIIDEKEHNNQIVPEIFFEIQRSKFVVVDITVPNHGAYYEAGYAQALGKEVIICCRDAEFHSRSRKKRPHFDISQKSMIVWKDENELVERLKRRIEATVR